MANRPTQWAPAVHSSLSQGIWLRGGGQMTADLRRTAKQTAHGWTSPLLWALAAPSVMSHMATIVLHLPQAVGGAMLASCLTLFGLLHGASTYGWRGILFFLVVCLGVSHAFENLSSATGFPVGR